MIFEQYYLGCLSQASYLIGDEQTRTAVGVDPRRDIDEYLEDAAKAELAIRHVILTHFHADFVAGHLELRDRVGARIYLGAHARAEYDFTPLADGDVLEFGTVRLRILETPGHTPEGISILVYDLAADSGTPHAVLTGDTLFIGDVGRPDLLASAGMSAEALAGMLYDSLRDKLLRLPDVTRVYPGHGAGSACGKNLSAETVSTIGAQRRDNYALQPMSREAFVKLMTTDQPEAPAYFGYDAELNRTGRLAPLAELEARLAPLTLDQVLEARRAGGALAAGPDRRAVGERVAAGNDPRRDQCSPPPAARAPGRDPHRPSRRPLLPDGRALLDGGQPAGAGRTHQPHRPCGRHHRLDGHGPRRRPAACMTRSSSLPGPGGSPGRLSG